MKGEDHKDVFIVGIDIAGYSLKPLQAQQRAQVAIDRALSESVKRHGNKTHPPHEWLDAGDGGYALFEWSSARDIVELIKDFCEVISRDNAPLAPEHAVSVRIALHRGQVICWGPKNSRRHTSHAINQCARFLDGMSRDPGRIICSKEFLERITAIGEIAKATRLIDVVDKHGLKHQIYNLQCDPGFGCAASNIDLHVNPFAP